MLSSERAEFEVQLAVLFGGWPQTFLTPERKEAYWRGLEKMPLSRFIRSVDLALGEKAPPKVPSVNELWQLSNTLRYTSSQPAQAQAKPDTEFEPIAAHAQKCLLKFLTRGKQVFSTDELALLLLEKNRLAKAYASIYTEDKTLTGTEIREAMFKAFDKLVASWTSEREVSKAKAA